MESKFSRKQHVDDHSSFLKLFEYWTNNSAILRNQYNVHANELLSSGAIALAVGVTGGLSAIKTGHHASLFFSASFLLAIIPLLPLASRLKFWIAKNSSMWLAMVIFSGIVGSLLNICKVYEMNLIPDPSSICIIMAVSVSFPLFAKLRHCFIFFAIMACLPYLLLKIMGYEQNIPALILPFGNGTMFGLLLLSYNISRNYRAFYEAHINKKYSKHLTTELQKTVYPHQLELLNQDVPITETMPTAPSLGFACELDIIGSSKHRGEKRYFEFYKQEAFKNAYQIIDADYEINPENSKQPYSNGFKLKELGDGYIFTVNYPFRLKNQENIADQTIELVLEMLQAVNSAFTNYDAPVHCAVSVGYEQLSGFWTKGSSTVYDIDQVGITKASRISSLRSQIIANDSEGNYRDGHLILIAENVYHMLSTELAKGFRPHLIADMKVDTKGGFGQDEKLIYVKLVSAKEIGSRERMRGVPRLKIVS